MSKAELKSRSKLTEQTLFIVKPDGVKRKLVGEILSRFEKKGFVIIKLKMFSFTKELASEFYSIHKEKPFFRDLINFSFVIFFCLCFNSKYQVIWLMPLQE